MRQRPLVAVFAAVFAARRTLASPTARLVSPLVVLYPTLAYASRDEAFLLLEPERCEAGGCPELSAFWDATNRAVNSPSSGKLAFKMHVLRARR